MENTIVPGASARQIRLFALVFAALFALLALGYYYFLRTEYAVLYSGLRPADASAIVAELDSKGVAYELKDKGATILVPKDESDSVRLAIAGSDAPMKGSAGFELFNKSDMGLTDFAQKINYQRALQGELARTIMMMDGIENARVHLTIPERTLFRGSRSEPKAAVTLTLQRGKVVDAARVAGIQRLVAAAVPDLKLFDVVVLDELGRIISPAAEPAADLPPELAERQAAQDYFRARVRSAVEAVLPGLGVEAKVLIVPDAAEPESRWESAETAAQGTPLRNSAQEPAGRNFRLRVTVITPAPVNPQDQQRVREALERSVGLKPESGDALIFGLPVAEAAPAEGLLPGAATAATGSDYRPLPAVPAGPSLWMLLTVIGVGLVALGLGFRRRSAGMAPEQRDLLVVRIRRQLALMDESRDGQG
jgi:flagellar M-ring protein FliF